MQPEQGVSPPIDIRTQKLEQRRAPTYSVRKLSEKAAPIRRLDELTHIIGRAANHPKDSTYLSPKEYRRSVRIAEGVKEQQDSKTELQKAHEKLHQSRAILKSYQADPESKMAGHYREQYHIHQSQAMGAWIRENRSQLIQDLQELAPVIYPIESPVTAASIMLDSFTDVWEQSDTSQAPVKSLEFYYATIKPLLDEPAGSPGQEKALEVWNKLATEIGTITEGKIVISQKGRTVSDLQKAGEPVDVVQLKNEETKDTVDTADPRGIVVTDVRTPGLYIDDSIIAPVDEPINAKVVGEYRPEKIIYTEADYDEALEKVEESRHAFYRAAVTESPNLIPRAEQYDSVQKEALLMWVKAHKPLLQALMATNSYEMSETDRNIEAKKTILWEMEHLDYEQEFSEVAIHALIPLYQTYQHWDIVSPLDKRKQTSKEVYDALKEAIEQISHGLVRDQDDLAAMSEAEIESQFHVRVHPIEVQGFDHEDILLRDKRHSVVTDVYEPGLYVDESLPERVKRVFGEREATVKTKYTLSQEDQEKNRKPATEKNVDDDISDGEFRILEQPKLEDKSSMPRALLPDHGGNNSSTEVSEDQDTKDSWPAEQALHQARMSDRQEGHETSMQAIQAAQEATVARHQEILEQEALQKAKKNAQFGRGHQVEMSLGREEWEKNGDPVEKAEETARLLRIQRMQEVEERERAEKERAEAERSHLDEPPNSIWHFVSLIPSNAADLAKEISHDRRVQFGDFKGVDPKDIKAVKARYEEIKER